MVSDVSWTIRHLDDHEDHFPSWKFPPKLTRLFTSVFLFWVLKMPMCTISWPWCQRWPLVCVPLCSQGVRGSSPQRKGRGVICSFHFVGHVWEQGLSTPEWCFEVAEHSRLHPCRSEGALCKHLFPSVWIQWEEFKCGMYIANKTWLRLSDLMLCACGLFCIEGPERQASLAGRERAFSVVQQRHLLPALGLLLSASCLKPKHTPEWGGLS